MKYLVLTVAGYASAGLCVLVWFYHIGALQDLIDLTIRGPLSSYLGTNKLPYGYMMADFAVGSCAPVLNLLPGPIAVIAGLLFLIPALLVAALPVLVLSVAGVSLIARPPIGNLFRLPIVSYLATGFAVWFSEIHRKDIMHLIYGCRLLLIALLLLWDSFDRGRIAAVLLPTAIGVPLLLFAATRGIIASVPH